MKKILLALLVCPIVFLAAEPIEAQTNEKALALEKRSALASGITTRQFEQTMTMPEVPAASFDLGSLDAANDQQKVVLEALNYLGVPYVWGGATPAGFDCSGLVSYVFERAVGKPLPHYTVSQEAYGKEVKLSELQLGDLVFYGERGASYHVGIYVGEGKMIHAPQPGESVKVIELKYYQPDFARRLLSEGPNPNQQPANTGEGLNERYIFRLYNPNQGEHFYTANVNEAASLRDRSKWQYEGLGWVAPRKGKAVYRLCNPNNSDHVYTISAEEAQYLKKVGWRDEGISWYSGGAKPLYRLYNPNATVGSHHYTLSQAERDYLIKQGWQAEGVAWYALRAY